MELHPKTLHIKMFVCGYTSLICWICPFPHIIITIANDSFTFCYDSNWLNISEVLHFLVKKMNQEITIDSNNNEWYLSFSTLAFLSASPCGCVSAEAVCSHPVHYQSDPHFQI